jgi:hypothetical protein
MMYCSKCGKETKDDHDFCMGCGLKAERVTDNSQKGEVVVSNVIVSKKLLNKKIIGIIGVAVIVAVIAIVGYSIISTMGVGGLEREARGYYRQLRNMYNVTSLDAVVCITKKYWGDDHATRGYLFVYNGGRFAYFDKGEYKGNGSNGGSAMGDARSFHNIHSLSAQKTYMEFLLDGSHLISFEDIKNDVIGLFPLDERRIR